MSLATTWYVLLALFAMIYAALDGYDLGVGIAYPLLGRSEQDKAELRQTIGPLWDGNEVWLINIGGATLAVVPIAHAAVLGGLYPLAFIVLFGLILRAVSLEYHGRGAHRTLHWDAGFFVGSLAPTLGFGLLVGNLVRGVPVNDGAISASFGSLFDGFAWLVALLAVVAFAAQGFAWAAFRSRATLCERSLRALSATHWLLLPVLAGATIADAYAAPDHFESTLGRWPGWLALAAVSVGLIVTRLALIRRRVLPTVQPDAREVSPLAVPSVRWELIAFMATTLVTVGLIGVWVAGNYPHLVPDAETRGAGIELGEAVSNRLSLLWMLILTAITVPVIIGYQAFVHGLFGRKIGPAEEEY